MKRIATQLINAVGWLERRQVEIKRITASRARPVIEISAPCPDLVRRSTAVREVTPAGVSLACVARVQGCVIHWRREVIT